MVGPEIVAPAAAAASGGGVGQSGEDSRDLEEGGAVFAGDLSVGVH